MFLRVLLVRVAIVALTAATGGFPVYQGDRGTQVPVFRSRIDTVRTEVAVIDNKSGRPIRGLTKEDFTVLENNIPQTITSFADASSESQPNVDHQGKSRRVFVFVFGSGYLHGPVSPYDGVVDFIRTKLDDGDLAGCLFRNRLTALSADHELIASVVERIKNPSRDLDDAFRRDSFARVDQPSPETQVILDAWLRVSGAPADFLRSATGLLLGTPEPGMNPRVRHWNSALVMFDTLKVVAAIEGIRKVEGEKHVVLLSDYGFNLPIRLADQGSGLLFDSKEDDEWLAARANDARVAIDIIHTRGTDLSPFPSISSSRVAENSGGLFSSTRTAAQHLARIDDASRGGYILGYVPMKNQFDGKYRAVTVKVNRKDVSVVYRHGYTALADAPPVDPEAVLTRLRLRDAVATELPLDDIRVHVSVTSSRKVSENYIVGVDVKIDPAGLSLSEDAGRWAGKINLLLLLGDSKHNVLGKVDQEMTLGISAALFQQAKVSGIPYSAILTVKSPPAQVKAIVYDPKTDRIGSAAAIIR